MIKQLSTAEARFRHHVFSLFRFNMLAFVVRLLTSAVVARVMGPAAMGLWLLLTLLPTYAEGFGRLKADLAAVYVLGQSRWSLGEVCTALNVIALLTSGVIAAVLLVVQGPVGAMLFPDQQIKPIHYRMIVLTIPVHFVAMGYAYLLLHFDDVRAYNVQNFLRTVLPGMLAAALLLMTDLRIGALISAMLIGGVLGLAYAGWAIHRRERLSWKVRPGLYAALLTYGRKLYLAGMIEHLNQYLASLLVGVHLATRELAFFRLGQDRLQLLDQIPSSINTLLYPKVANTPTDQAQIELISRSIRTLALLVGVCALTGAALAPLAVWVLYGSDFMPMVWSIWLLLPGVYALGVTSPATQFFMGRGRPDLVWKLALVPLLVQIVTLAPAMNWAGFRGAALAVSVSFLASASVRVAVLSRITGRTAQAFLVPCRSDIKTVKDFAFDRLRPGIRILGMKTAEQVREDK